MHALQVHPNDNVLVALRDFNAGQMLNWQTHSLKIKSAIPAKHKVALHPLTPGDAVIMYGVLVGRAVQPIEMGEAITTQNVKHAATEPVLRTPGYAWTPPDVSAFREQTFLGYHRSDGRVGTANYWLVVPLVFCENRNIEVLREALIEKLGYAAPRPHQWNVDSLIRQYQTGASRETLLTAEIDLLGSSPLTQRLFPHVDGIKFLTHAGGCGGTRQDSDALCALLAGYITHPNVAGATVLSLGCQHAQVKILEAAIQKINPNFNKPLYVLGQQESKSEPDFIAQALRQTFVGLTEANLARRQPAPLSKLVVGLECGGSDGFSGISANPTLGYFSDLLVALGGTPVLSEFPELNGVEQDLVDRSVSLAVAQKFLDLMTVYAERARQAGSGFDMNPSPGNIKDGLITDAMKSAGAAKKGGTSPIVAVLDYTEQVQQRGLHLLCTPGNDVESTTALAGSGCNLILFTTGLGTPTGNPIAPTVKVASNTQLYQKMHDVIDFNTGDIITGESTIETKAHQLLQYVIQVASGEATPHAVRLQQDDFIPWKRGVSL
jgi:altronate hydrolase